MATMTPTISNTSAPSDIPNIENSPTESPSISPDLSGISPERALATIETDEMDKKYGYGKFDTDAQTKTVEDMRQDMAKDILGKMTENLGTGEKAALNYAAVGAGLIEDTFNIGVDVINASDRMFGDGEDLIKPMTVVQDAAPKGTGWEISREFGKFMVSYSSILKGMNTLARPEARAAVKGTQVAAAAAADFILAKKDVDGLAETLIRNVPAIGEDFHNWMNDPQDAGLETRFKKSLLGIADGAMVDTVMKAFKLMAKSNVIRKFTESDIPTRTEREGIINAKPIEVNADDLPPIPKEGELPAIPTEDVVDDIPTITKKEVDSLPELPTDEFLTAQGTKAEGVVENLTEEGPRFRDAEGNPTHLNISGLDNTASMRDRITKKLETRPADYAKKDYTFDEIAKIADDKDMTARELLEWTKDTGLTLGHVKASTDLVVDYADAFMGVVERWKGGTATRDELAIAYSKVSAMINKLSDMASLSGLMLKESDIPIGIRSGEARSIKDIVSTFGDDAEAAANALFNEGAGIRVRPGIIVRAFQNTAVSKVGDFINGTRYAGMLSNPDTHLRNIVSGIQTTSLRLVDTTMGATINAIEAGKSLSFKRDPQGLYFSDAAYEAMGLIHGTVDAVTIIGKALKAGKKPTGFKGVDPRKAKVFANGAREVPESNIGKAADFLLHDILGGQIVSKALNFEDGIFKHINASMTQRQLAYKAGRIAQRNGKNADEVAAAIKKELENPSTPTMLAMYKDAEYSTFTKDIPSIKTTKNGKVTTTVPLTAKLQDISNVPVMKLVAPFAKININNMLYKFERIPFVRQLMPDIRANLNSLDPAVRQLQEGKMVTASVIVGGAAAYLHSSDAIIGSGPKDSSKYKIYEQAGRLRDSITITNHTTGKVSQIEYRRETPIGGILGFVADMADLTDMVMGTNDQIIADTTAVGMSIVAQLYNPDYLTSSFSTLFEAMAKGDVNSASTVLGKVGGDIALQFAPYAGAARAYNRNLTEAGSLKRETFNPADMLNTLTNRVKDIYMPSKLPFKRNILGDEMKHKAGLGPQIISPFGTQEQSSNLVIKELARLAGADNVIDPQTKVGKLTIPDNFINVTMPPKTIKVTVAGLEVERSLNMEEYEKLVLYSAGKITGERGEQTLEDTLSKIMQSRDYQKMSFMAQGSIVNEIISEYRSIGKEIFVSEFITNEEDFHKATKVFEKVLEKEDPISFGGPKIPTN